MSSTLYKELGFDNNDLQVYSALVSNRVRSIEEISILTSINEETVQLTLQKLISKKFVRLIGGKVNQYIALAPPIAVTAEVNKKIKSELEIIQNDIENIWNKGKTDFKNFLDTLQEQINENVEFMSQNMNQSFNSQLKAIIAELESQKDQLANLSSNEKTNVENQINQWKENIRNEYSNLNSEVTNEITNSANLLDSQFLDNTNKFKQRLTTALGERSEILSTIIEQSGKNLENINTNLNTTINQLNEHSQNTNTQVNTNLDQIVEREDNLLSEVTKDNVESISQLWEDVKSSIQTFWGKLIADNDDLLNNLALAFRKISEKITYFKNISNEEFLSFNSSSSLMLGQMQSTTTENISNTLSRISENMSTLYDELKASISESNTFINNQLADLSSSINENLQKSIESVKTQNVSDKNNLTEIMNTISTSIEEEFQNENVRLEELINSFGEEISKVNRDLTDELPRTFDDNIAILKDQMNNFDRQIRGNLNTIKTKLSSVKEQIDLKLSKRLSVGKSGLEEIREDVASLLNEYTVTQNRVYNMVEDQLASLEEFNQNLATVVNKKIRENDYKIQKLLETTSESLISSLNNQLKTIKSEISKASTTINNLLSQKESDLDTELTNLNVNIYSTFDKFKQTFNDFIETQSDKLSQINIRPKIEEVSSTFLNEINSFIKNIELAIQQSSQSGADRFQEVVDDQTNSLYKDLDNIQKNIADNKIIAKEQFDSSITEFETSISTFTSKLKESNTTLVERIRSERSDSLNQLQNEFVNALSQYNRLSNTSKQEFDQVSLQLAEVLNLNFMNLDKTLNDEKVLLIDDLNQNFSDFSSGNKIILEKSTKNCNEAKDKLITDSDASLNGIWDSYVALMDESVKNYNSRRSDEKDRIDNLISQSIEGLDSALNKNKVEFIDKTGETNSTISEKLDEIIVSLPTRIKQASGDTSNLNQLIADVQKAAIESPESPLDHTYFVRGKSKAELYLKSVLQRTKSTIQVMIPSLSTDQVETFLSAGTRKRIQILTGSIDSSNIKKVIEAGNIQIKIFDRLQVHGTARDGSEEASLGTGTPQDFQMIVTTEPGLIGAFKEIFQDLWPRGKNM